MVELSLQKLEQQNEFNEFKLNSLLEITSAINANQDVAQILKIYEFVLKEQLGFSRFMLLNKQESWNCLLKTGIKTKIKNVDIETELLRFKEITVIASSHSKLLSEFEIIVPVFHNEIAVAYLLFAGIPNDGQNRKKLDQLSFIQTLTNIMVVAIENKRMAKNNIIQARIKKDLEMASLIQKQLFPSDLPSNRKMDISAKYISRHEIGGDYYDFIPLGDDEYIICIGDVSGKGVGAALLMTNFQATIRTLFSYQRFDLEFLIEELNKKVMKSAKGEKFITFFIAHYNAQTHELKYVNAGHNHPILTNGKKVEMLHEGCIGLGMLDELPQIRVGTRILKPNTTIVLYTDGLVELENNHEEQFGNERLIKLLHQFYPLKMEDMNNIIMSKLDEFKGELPFVDDTAIFSCRFF